MEDDCHTSWLGLGLSITTQRHDDDDDDDRYEPAMKQPIISNHNFFHDECREKSSVPRLDLSFKLFPNGAGRDLVTRSSPSIDTEGQCKSGGRKVMMDGRKKLRLSKEKTSLLENTFKLQTTLNTARKQALAEQLKLTPRQVEVWFQNRRARTKLKQTEVDCEFLKKCCESLSNENKRLKIELQDLRHKKNTDSCPQALMAMTTCQSCQKRNVSSSGTDSSDGGQPYDNHNKPQQQ